MKTRGLQYGLVGLAGMLLLALPVLGRADIPWGAGGIVAALEACEAELASCQAQPGITFPGDGWPEDSPEYALPGGAPLSYAGPGEFGEGDPPEGTFIDLNTGLMWEMKLAEDDPLCLAEDQVARDVHCVKNEYTWTAEIEEPYLPNGTAFTEFLAELKGELGGEPFAGYDDWRLPTAKELQSLVDYSRPNPEEPGVPAVSDELPGATARSYYWSSTAYAYGGDVAWGVFFDLGDVHGYYKVNDNPVRAVRGGW